MDFKQVNRPDLAVVVATRNYGKTTLLERHLNKNVDRFSMYDVNHEYNPIVLNAVLCRTFSDLKLCLRRNEPRIIFRPKTSSREIFEFWCAVHWFLASEYLLVISEINRFFISRSKMQYSSMLVDMGRHGASGNAHLGIVGDCRRVLGLDMDFLANCTHMFIGRLILKADIDYLKDYINKEELDKCMRFEVGDFLYINGRGEATQVKNTDI